MSRLEQIALGGKRKTRINGVRKARGNVNFKEEEGVL
jgi:hypothetical protein